MAGKKVKKVRKKQRAKRQKAEKKRRLAIKQSSRPRWVGWMREENYEELRRKFGRRALGTLRTTIREDAFVFPGLGTDPFVRAEFSAPNSHADALAKWLFKKTNPGFGRYAFVRLESRERCPVNCKFSRDNLFLVGCFNRQGRKFIKFRKETYSGSLLDWASEIIEYPINNERRVIVEIYVDKDATRKRVLVQDELMEFGFLLA